MSRAVCDTLSLWAVSASRDLARTLGTHLPTSGLDIFGHLRKMNKRQLYYQVLNFAMIMSSAFMIWKDLIVLTGSKSLIMVVLSGSMEPAFHRDDGWVEFSKKLGECPGSSDGTLPSSRELAPTVCRARRLRKILLRGLGVPAESGWGCGRDKETVVKLRAGQENRFYMECILGSPVGIIREANSFLPTPFHPSGCDLVVKTVCTQGHPAPRGDDVIRGDGSDCR
ncbi:hypothetical protein HPG69_004662 [Diceros bicornis minor]|uniref:Uncharacterized protein n=1 Tax=Diceros bicornis minor TaxID=77932 RepID=A0A7J7E482_DICBM|nr:hypothetical protein HPG69_004662 [Diceros bicornis minor]